MTAIVDMNDSHIQEVVPLMAKFSLQSQNKIISEELLAKGIKNPKYGLNNGFWGLVAVVEKEIIGYITYWFQMDTITMSPYLYVDAMYIEKEHRRERIAYAFAKKTGLIAKEKNIGQVCWYVEEKNSDARSLYDTYPTTYSSPYLECQAKPDDLVSLILQTEEVA